MHKDWSGNCYHWLGFRILILVCFSVSIGVDPLCKDMSFPSLSVLGGEHSSHDFALLCRADASVCFLLDRRQRVTPTVKSVPSEKAANSLSQVDDNTWTEGMSNSARVRMAFTKWLNNSYTRLSQMETFKVLLKSEEHHIQHGDALPVQLHARNTCLQ